MCTHKSISDCALYFKVKPGESEDWRLPKLATNPLDTAAIIRSQKVLEMVDYLSLSILIKYVLNYILDFLEYVYSSFYQLLVIIT